MDNDIICLDDTRNENKEPTDENVKRRHDALEHCRHQDDVILLSSDDEETRTSPSIIEEMTNVNKSIHPRTSMSKKATTRFAEQDTLTPPRKKRRGFSPCASTSSPSVIEVCTLNTFAFNQRPSCSPVTRRIVGSESSNLVKNKPGRRVKTTLISKNRISSEVKDTTSEKYLKLVSKEQNEAQFGFSSHSAKTTSEIIVDSLKEKTTSEKIVESMKMNDKSIKSPTDSVVTEKPGVIPKSINIEHEQSRLSTSSSQSNKLVNGLDVQGSVDLFLKACENVLPADEYGSVEKKMKKYLNQMSQQFMKSVRLKNYIEMKWGLLDSDHDNVYIQIREVLDEMKKYRQEGRSGTTSDLSDTNLSKKKSSSTAFQPLRKVVLDELVDTPLCPQIPKVSDLANSSHQTNSSTHQINVKTQTRSGFDCNLDTDIGSDIGSISHAQPSSLHQPTASSSSSNQHTSPSISDKDKRVKKKHKKKLERALALCEKKIRQLEETEVDFDDDNDSVYILEAKYKKRYMEIYRKLAACNKLSSNLERRSDKQFKFEDSKYVNINLKLSKFVNRTKQFPDFVDIRQLVEETNQAQSLNLSEIQIHNEAEHIFQAVGKKLKNRRAHDDCDSLYSHFKELRPVDPADNDTSLEEKLQNQQLAGKKRIEKVFQDYVEKQICRGKSASDDAESDMDSTDNHQQMNKDSRTTTGSSQPDNQQQCNGSLSEIRSSSGQPTENGESNGFNHHRKVHNNKKAN